MVLVQYTLRFVILFFVSNVLCILFDQFVLTEMTSLLLLPYPGSYIFISRFLHHIPTSLIIATLGMIYIWSASDKIHMYPLYRIKTNYIVFLILLFALFTGIGYYLKQSWVPESYHTAYNAYLVNPNRLNAVTSSTSPARGTIKDKDAAPTQNDEKQYEKQYIEDLVAIIQTGDFEKAEQKILSISNDHTREMLVVKYLWQQVRNQIYNEFKIASQLFKYTAYKQAYFDYYEGRYEDALKGFDPNLVTDAHEKEMVNYFRLKVSNIQELNVLGNTKTSVNLKDTCTPFNKEIADLPFLYKYYQELALLFQQETYFIQQRDEYQKLWEGLKETSLVGKPAYTHEMSFFWMAETLKVTSKQGKQANAYKNVLIFFKDIFINKSDGSIQFEKIYLLHPDNKSGIQCIDHGVWQSQGINFDRLYYVTRTKTEIQEEMGRLDIGTDFSPIQDFNLTIRYYPKWQPTDSMYGTQEATRLRALPEIFLFKKQMMQGEWLAYLLFPLLGILLALWIKPNLKHVFTLPPALFYTLILLLVTYLLRYSFEMWIKLFFV